MSLLKQRRGGDGEGGAHDGDGMTEQPERTRSEELLAAILEEPDDDARRLVYADMLSDAGDPKGELIMVECELARLGCSREDQLFLEWVGDELADRDALDSGQVARLRAREAALLKKHRVTWAEEVLGPKTGLESTRFRRGFVDHVVWDARARANASLSEVLRRAPVTSLMPGFADAEELARFLSGPGLASIREIYTVLSTEVGVESFAAAPLLELRRLQLAHPGGHHEIRALARAPFTPYLTGLVLAGFGLSNIDILTIERSLGALRELQLSDTRLGGEAFAALGRLPRLDALRVLAVVHGRLASGEAAGVLASPALEHLEALNLRSNKLGAADTEAIGARFPSLRVLDLGNNPLAEDAVTTLLTSGGLGTLQALRLEKTGTTDAGVKVLARSPLAARLRSLDLRKNAITDTGAKALRASAFPSLRTLHLGGNKLSASMKKSLREELPDAHLYL